MGEINSVIAENSKPKWITYRNKLTDHPRYSFLVKWIKLISITGFAQIIVQATGLISGIMVIRLLPTDEYALYTLANTMLGTMTVLSDGGISSGVMAQGGKVWQDKEKLGIVLATGLDLRKKFAVGSLIIATPILAYLLLHHGASALTTILIIASLIPAFFAALSDSLLEIVPKLHQEIFPLQRNQVNVSIGRLLLTGLTLFVFPWTFVAILAGGFPRVYGNIKLRKIVQDFVVGKQLPDSKIRIQILGNVKRILPGAIYYCLSGQVTIWVISIFGETKSIAEIGALGRLSMALSLISALYATLIVPQFARLEEKRELVLKRYLQIQFSCILLMGVIVALARTFPEQILLLIGNNYSGLADELALCLIGSCFNVMAGTAFSLYTCRGWAINPLISIPILLSSTVFGILIFDSSSLKGVLLLNIFLSVVAYLLNNSYFLLKLLKIK